MKTKSGNKFNVEGDLIYALSCVEPRISLVSNNKQAQPSIDLLFTYGAILSPPQKHSVE